MISKKGPEPDSQVLGEIECEVPALSICRLGHHLQLSELVELTLAWFNDNLTPDNVIFELSRDWTGGPTEMKEKILAFAIANWADVKRSHTTPVLKTILEQGQQSVALIELMVRLVLKVE